jgi:uncharacterized SAM-binding protein YcdF (DUF218 family)
LPIRPRTPPKPRTSVLRHWTLWVWFVLAVFLSVGGVCLWRSGRWLVHEDPFGHVKWGLVLAGESRDCERTDAAIRLFQEGRIDTVVLSASRIFKNRYQSEFMVDYAVQQGVPRDRIFEFRQDAYSTQEEARLLVRQFRLQNLDTVLIITSSYHTARTRRIFRRLAQGYPVVLVASADYHLYDPNAWWSNRESRKLWLDEWIKSFFTAYELWRAHPETGKAEYQGLTPDPWNNGPGPALPAAGFDKSPRASGDSAARAAAEKAVIGKEKSIGGGADSLKPEGRGPEAADSARAHSDTAQSAAGSARETKGLKDTASAEAAKPGEPAKTATEAVRAENRTTGATAASHEAAREAEAKKASAHASKKPSTPAAKSVKHEEKKPEKSKKKG